jgi:hypothetical protein
MMRYNFSSWTAAAVAASLLCGCASAGGGASQPTTLVDKSTANLSVRKLGKETFRLTLAGQGAPSRDMVNNRLAFEAAKLTERESAQWFEAVVPKDAGWTPPAADPMGKRFSFRMENWRPSWSVEKSKPAGAGASATPGFRATIDVVVHKGRFDGINPLGFSAGPLDDYLKQQVLADG